MDGSHTCRRARALRFEAVEPRLLLSAEWAGLDRVRAEYGLTGQGQTVVVIDTGVDYRHVALGGGLGTGYRVVGGYDFAEQDANPNDDGPRGGHGTHVAGTIAGTDPAHLGIAPGVDIVALRVFDDNGLGTLGRVQQAIQWVHANRNAFRYPITTVNVALGVRTGSGAPPGWESFEDDLAQLEADGMFISVAAGNGFVKQNQPGVNYPASSPHVVPVASADSDGSLSYFSQRDARSLLAPGSGIVSTVPDYDGNRNGTADDFAGYSGTSMAAAFVSGASVLLRQACQLAGVQDISQQSLYSILVSTSDTVRDPATGRDYHRINLDRAVDSVMLQDDFGSSEATAFDLGLLSTARSISGRIERAADADWFRFTAAQSGTLTVTRSATGDLQPQWKLPAALAGTTQWADGSLTLDVVAGQTYSIGLASAGGVGSYVIDANLTPVVRPPDPGPVSVLERRGVRVDTAGQWFALTAPAEGVLSIEAAFSNALGDVDLQLFDSAGKLVASSGTTTDGERIEVPATAGAKFSLRAFTYPGSGANDRVDFRVTGIPVHGGRPATKSSAAAADRVLQVVNC